MMSYKAMRQLAHKMSYKGGLSGNEAAEDELQGEPLWQ